MSSKKRVIAVVITTAALTVGSFGAASAATKTKVVKKTSITKTTNAITYPLGMDGRMSAPKEALTSVLAGLVTKGTISQAQADAITADLETYIKSLPPKIRGERHGKDDRDDRRGPKGGAPKIPAPSASN